MRCAKLFIDYKYTNFKCHIQLREGTMNEIFNRHKIIKAKDSYREKKGQGEILSCNPKSYEVVHIQNKIYIIDDHFL